MVICGSYMVEFSVSKGIGSLALRTDSSFTPAPLKRPLKGTGVSIYQS